MSETMSNSEQNQNEVLNMDFGEPIEMEEYGYSFRPVNGFNLEIDGSVYMYSEDGSFEINLVGGKLEDQVSIAELNNSLASAFMTKVSNFDLIEAGTDTIQGITGFLNEIKFTNVEEEGFGHALICSPFINQFFFILVIATSNDWQMHGLELYKALKSQIVFHPQFKPVLPNEKSEKHPDLTIETFGEVTPDEKLILSIEKKDISLLLAARSQYLYDEIWVTEIFGPGGNPLYRFNQATGELQSEVSTKPILGDNGEVCVFLPSGNLSSLQAGEYQFGFANHSGAPIQEVQVIIRSGCALNQQNFNINFWIATNDAVFSDSSSLEAIEQNIKQTLSNQLLPFSLTPRNIEYFQAAPEELSAFSTLNIETDLPDCSYMISNTVNNNRALNIALVDQLVQGSPPVQSEKSAYSVGFPGMILSTNSPHACVVLQWPLFKDDIGKMAETIIEKLMIFCGIDIPKDQSVENQPPIFNHEVAWRIRRHPLFYNAD